MHISSCAKHMQSLKKMELTVRGVELTKYILVDVLVDRHSDRRAERPILIVSFTIMLRDSQASQYMTSYYNWTQTAGPK